MMGEEEALALGINLARLKWIVLTTNVLMIAAATNNHQLTMLPLFIYDP
jgi:ABC-type Fe3+-siderophore transport system permease subunit